jgi:hypothetical protein
MLEEVIIFISWMQNDCSQVSSTAEEMVEIGCLELLTRARGSGDACWEEEVALPFLLVFALLERGEGCEPFFATWPDLRFSGFDFDFRGMAGFGAFAMIMYWRLREVV